MVGSLLKTEYDARTRKTLIVLELEGNHVVEMMKLIGKKISAKISAYRKKRSLDANAYAWVIMSKIAEVLYTDKNEVYEDMLQKYGYLYQDEDGYVAITVKSSVDMSKIDGHWKFYRQGARFKAYLKIKGTSEYDSREMAHFIDCVVQEAKDLDIETLPPEEIERMKQQWQKA